MFTGNAAKLSHSHDYSSRFLPHHYLILPCYVKSLQKNANETVCDLPEVMLLLLDEAELREFSVKCVLYVCTFVCMYQCSVCPSAVIFFYKENILLGNIFICFLSESYIRKYNSHVCKLNIK